MSEPLAVGQFAIVDHEPVDRGPCVGVFHGRGPAGDRPELYVLAEGTSTAGEQFAAHVISAAGQAWAAVDMSLTGSLRRLFAEAERNLRDWNDKSIAQHRVSLGLSAVARRGRQVVLAQAGPSLAFHLKSGSARLYGPEAEHARAIGGSNRPTAPQLRGLVVEPGDRVLLINTAALEVADQDLIGAILSLPADEVLRDLYQRVREARSISVLLLTLPEAADSGHPSTQPRDEEPTIGEDEAGAEGEFIIGVDTPSPSESAYQPSLFIAPAGASTAGQGDAPRSFSPRAISEELPAVQEALLEPLRRAAGEHGLVFMDRSSTDSPSESAQGEARTPGARASEVRARRGARGGESFYRGLRPTDRAVPRPPASAGDAPPVEALARHRREQSSPRSGDATATLEATAQLAAGTSLVEVREGPRGRWRGSGSIGGRQRLRPPQASWLLISLVLLAAVLGVALFALPSQFRESSDERYARLVAEAGAAVAAAQDEEDPAARREMLTVARATLLEAREVHRGGSEVSRLVEDVTTALAQLDAVFTPVSVEEVASLEEFGDQPLAISRLVVGSGVVYMLDPAAGLVVAVATNGGDKGVAFQADEALGTGTPIAAAALEAEPGDSRVVLLDDANALWLLHLSEPPEQIPFEAPAGLQVADMTAAGASLYLLDSSAATVYSFQLGPDGRASNPTVALEAADLANAQYLLVSDGFITVDYDGTIHRFDKAVALKLSLAGIDTPLVAAEPPQDMGGTGNIAILDPSMDRVVVASSDGTFVRQYRHEDFAQITALVTSQRGSFVVSGGALRTVIWE
ncbi:MAG: hypothetical protein ACE5EF_01560 [Dehalococcoidia bacterium]